MNKIIKIENNLKVEERKSNNIVKDVCYIIDSAKNYAYRSINIALVERNWLLGYRIYEEELKGKERANYGLETIKYLSRELTKIYGKGFDRSNLYNFLQFYKYFPDMFSIITNEWDNVSQIFHAASGKLTRQNSNIKNKIDIIDNFDAQEFVSQIVDAVCRQLKRQEKIDIKYDKLNFDTTYLNTDKILSWTHYRLLIQVHDKEAREWYHNEAINEVWSARKLQRNINSQYYYRLLKSQNKDLVKNEMLNRISKYEDKKLEFIKNPVTLEFLGISKTNSFYENNLETSIITNLQRFLIELGKEYAFVARQKHIKTEKEDYYIDLVFYNYILKCFVLIDLKTDKITHQDVGQMDMYIRMYDELYKCNDDNPTIGILLCSETDEDIARFSVLHGNEQLFATKYLLYLPSKEELKREIKTQKALFYLKYNKNR